ncbi:MAG: CheR family methyltransferase [Pseudomonadota bacterium]
MSEGWTSTGMARIAEFCLSHTGLTSIERRVPETEAAVRRAMARRSLASPEEYLLRIQEDPALVDDLVDEIVVGETYFFREPETLQFLVEQVVPTLAASRAPGHVLNVWSAGCATGEEPYTLAILLDETVWRGRLRILATDISRAALARAERAEYKAWSLRTTSPAATARYFRRVRDRFALVKRYQRMVEFRHLNLVSDPFPDLSTGIAGFDIILCRNVLMYFPDDVVEGAARRLFRSLVPGGWLLGGASDPSLGPCAPFEVTVNEAGVFYRRPDAATTSEAAPRRAPAAPVEDAPRVTSIPGAPSPGLVAPPRGEPPEEVSATPEAADRRVRALANLGRAEEAEALARKTTSLFPDAAGSRLLLAMLLSQTGRTAEALSEMRKTLYLDHEAALAHFVYGLLLARSGKRTRARRAFRNARTLASALPAEAVLPDSEGQLAGSLAEAAAAQLAIMDRGPGGTG